MSARVTRSTRRLSGEKSAAVAAVLFLIWTATGSLGSPSGTEAENLPSPRDGLQANGTEKVRAVGPEDLQGVLDALRGRVVVLNFWATWCEPCREEFPGLVRIARENPAALSLVTVSLDDPDEADGIVRDFLAGMEAPGTRLIKAHGDPDPFIRSVDPDWSGALPATFIHGADGTRAHAIHAPVTYEKLKDLVTPLIDGP
jgi:thiol-disulfide isomerase/thioredoxin